MRVLHIISGNLDKGAARGTLWLHQEMLSQGLDSILLHTGAKTWNSKEMSIVSNKGNIRSLFVKVALRLWKIYLQTRYPKYSGQLFSSEKGLIPLTKLEEQFKPDVIHLHWINHFSIQYSSIGKVRAKLVWTLRDMWPFTGGCHYAVSCDRFNDGCGNCPLLGSHTENDLSSKIFKKKERYFPEKVHFTGISEWILREFKKSRLSSSNATFIPNAIHTSTWYPVDSKLEILEFANGRKTILVGAVNLSASYKGAEFILEVSTRLDNSKYCLIVFGKANHDFLGSIGLDILYLGVIHSNAELRAIYSSCDVYLFPSRVEAFGKTVLESILCGTPVICFDNSGPAEIVKHKQTGYLCKSYESDSLIEGINVTSSMKISEDIRSETAKYYNAERIVKDYIKLYKSI